MRRFHYIAIHIGPVAGGAVRTLDGHKERLAYLKEQEKERSRRSPATWTRADDAQAAEMNAIEALIADIEQGDEPPEHPLERLAAVLHGGA